MKFQIAIAAEGMGEGVNRAEAFLEGEGTLHRGDHHLAACGVIVTISNSAGQGDDGALQTVNGDGGGDGIIHGRGEAFDAMADRVHSGGSGEQGRQAIGEFGVADRAFRDEMGREEAELAAVPEADDSAAADFTASACRGGDGDGGRGGGGDPAHAAIHEHEGFERALMGGHDGDGFGEIHGGAAANRDQSVAMMGAIEREGGFRRFFRRVRGRAVKDGKGIALRQMGEDAREQTCSSHTRIGDDEGLCNASGLHIVGKM